MAREAWVRWGPEIEFANYKLTDEKNDYGLYMILESGFKRSRRRFYRKGANKELIYIGVVKSPNRKFDQRMYEHKRKWLHAIGDKQIYLKFGLVETYGKLDGNLIEDIESALVFQHEPSENTSKTRGYTITSDLVVHNIAHGGYVDATIHTNWHTPD